MKKVLFVCTGNAARSQMAAGLVNHDFPGRIEAFSAGTDPKGVSPFAVQVLKELNIDISQETSDHFSKYRNLDFDYIVTVCDQANESCPVFPGKGQRIHIGFPDPPHRGEESVVLLEYRKVRDEIRRTLGEFFQQEV
ncbi:arsenate reductase ArsC [Thermodesulfobacteriota bacterium]